MRRKGSPKRGALSLLVFVGRLWGDERHWGDISLLKERPQFWREKEI
jgi:hypothetical protein